MMAERAKASDLVVTEEAERHAVETPHGELIVWIKPLSWIARQNAITKFVAVGTDSDGNMSPQVDFGGYWEYLFRTCITKTDPNLTTGQLLNLKPEVGEQIQKLLPSFESLMEGLSGGMTGPLA